MERRKFLNFRSRRAAAGCLLGIIAAAAICLLDRAGRAPGMLPLGIAVGLAFLAAGAISPPDEGKGARIANFAWGIFALLAALLAGQLSLRCPLGNMRPGAILPNLICAALPFLLLTALTARPRLSLCLSCALLLALTAANYAVYTLRGTELTPADLFVARTALNVVGGYKLPLHGCFAASVSLWALILFSGLRLPRRARQPMRARALAATIAAALACVWFPAAAGLELTSFDALDTERQGLLLAFSGKLLESLRSPEPEGYSPERVAELENRYRAAEALDSTSDEAPAIIVIMNESFADLGALGSAPDANVPILPNFEAVRSRSIHGEALASTLGGGTVFSEYAFLTNNALERLPQRASVYNLYVKEPIRSLVSDLERLGYATYGTHPFHGSSYARDAVYPLLGFDHISFLEDYPQGDTIRGFVSDREMYAGVIEKYERRAPGEKFFLFGITVQNHGGYAYEGPDAPRLALREDPGRYPLAEQYLGLLRESDAALGELIGYFEDVDSPVVIAFFGDHLPNVEMEYLESLHGGRFETLDERELCYRVPFAVWANYEIPEQDAGLVGMNALSNFVYEAAGLELPPYNRFLRDMAEFVPAMNALGYYSPSAGRFLPYREAEGEEAAWLRDYDILQYNSLFDSEHRSALFFPAPDAIGAE